MPSSQPGLLALGLLTPVLLAAVLATWRDLQGTPARSVPPPSRCAGAAADGAPAPLQLTPEQVDLGRVAPASEHALPIAWRNSLGRDLRVVGTRSGCGCASWVDLPTRLRAGGTGDLHVCLTAPVVHGPIDVTLRLVTDAPAPGDVVGVRLRAFVGERLVVRPAALDLGRRTLGSRAPARLEVHLPPGCAGPVEVELGAWSGRAQVVPAARYAQHGADVLLDSELEGLPGPRVGLLHVRAAGAGAVSVPLRVTLEAPRAPLTAAARGPER